MNESVAAQLSWVGPPLRMEGRATFYAAVDFSGREFRLGEHQEVVAMLRRVLRIRLRSATAPALFRR
jgi:hypothetical protein